jgi:V/A-type H+-transporting ATPase subunit E
MSDPIPRVPPQPTDKDAHPTASGVQALIDTLREQGVTAGQAEAERIIATAKREAEALVDSAKRDAARIRESAKHEVDNERRAAHEALQLAARDTALELKSHLVSRFRSELGKLVHDTLRDPEVLKAVLLELARDTRERLEQDHADKPTRILIHTAANQTDAGQTDDPLAELTRSVARDMLKDGITIAADPSRKRAGMRVQIADEDVEVDLSDAAVSDLLAQHLLPRFRDLLEGTL